MKPTILAIPGSLRARSSNHAVIATAIALAGDRADFIVYEGLGKLPHFDDSSQPAETVVAFRKLIADTDGVLICSPEYAFGVPGSLKNALDWTVSSGEFINKPVALITAATGGDKAHASLQLTLRVISTDLPEQCTLLLSYIRSKMNAAGEICDEQTLNEINQTVNALLALIKTKQKSDL
ncbi:MAG: NAD(P)H-dependent oxidoreductase [Taibaiella sp.]|nr:NAD(P)H-dependent oxidoreductase [Taibaiella sp.]